MSSARPRFGLLLRRLRVAASLTQEALAERAGLSVDAISTLESGRRRWPHPSTVAMLADALDLGGKERQAFVTAATMLRPTARRSIPSSDLTSLPTDALPDRAPLPAGSRMPLAPNPLFIGRGDELLQVAAALRGGETTVALGQVVASTGLGGLGKTQLAVEFVHRYGCYFEGGVFWLSFASADEIPLQVAACAGSDAMDLAPGIESLPLEERVKRVQRAWQGADPRILVFDNCEEESLLEAWRPSSGGCRVLVTSRRAQWSPTLGVTTLPLDLLPRADSVELLRRYQPDLAAADLGLDAIADELGDLPLALHVLWAQGELTAARAIYERALAIRERVRRPDRPRAALGLNDLSVATHGRAELAAARPHLERALANRERELGPDHTDTAQALNDLGLVLWAQGELAAAEPLLKSALASYERLLGPYHPMTARSLNNLGVVLRDQGELAAARPLLERALHIRESVLGRDHPETAYSLNVMGRLLRAEGQLTAARSLFERALDIRERVLGPDHPRTAQMLNDLAVLHRDQGDPTAARSLFERALAIREHVLGPDHPDTVATRRGLEELDA